jgi:hypothetical protein
LAPEPPFAFKPGSDGLRRRGREDRAR